MPPKVRKVSKKSLKSEETNELVSEEKEAVEDFVVPETVKVVKKIPSAMVYVKDCACYCKDGKKYRGNTCFSVMGEEQIEYYMKDGHFSVVLQ